jgi:hypothetical protein
MLNRMDDHVKKGAAFENELIPGLRTETNERLNASLSLAMHLVGVPSICEMMLS